MRGIHLLLLVVLLQQANAFLMTRVHLPTHQRIGDRQRSMTMLLKSTKVHDNVVNIPCETSKSSPLEEIQDQHSLSLLQSLLPAVLSAAAVFSPVEDAMAAAADYGVLAGRTGSMLHPITMLLLFGTSVYAGYTGLQWRRLRGISDELKELQSQWPKLPDGTSIKYPVSDLISSLKSEMAAAPEDRLAVITKNLGVLNSANVADIDSKIGQLQATRKSLQNANLKDKHHATGSYLLSAGVTVALLGAFNTYMRAGKLFPGPHLYAGMACTILWACASALVPEMQKGNEAARIGHIGLNAINVALFAWQVGTGIEIMLKVWEKTSWP